MKQNKLIHRFKTIINIFPIVFLICLTLFSAKALAKGEEDFIVKNGILTKYNGTNSIVTIPSNVTEIGANAFRSNQKITEVVLHKNIKKIKKRAFYNCKRLATISLPEGLQVIGEEAFYHCIALKEIEFPKTMKSIDDGAFENCKRLERIIFPDKKITFGYAVFTGIKRGNAGEFGEFVIARSELIQYIERDDNVDVRIPDGVTKVNENAFAYAGTIEKLIIPGSIKKIEADVFSIGNIGSFVLEEGVEEIEDYAFQECAPFYELIVPSSVTIIGENIIDDFRKEELKIYCIKDSAMDKYAKKNGFFNIEYID